MTSTMRRRLDRLEAVNRPPEVHRHVWWNEGEPKPKAEPGEHLIICRWMWSDEEPPKPPSTAWQERPPDGQAPPPGR